MGIITHPTGHRDKKGKVSVKSQKKCGISWNFMKSDWFERLGGFEWILNFFSFTPSEPKKLKDSIFDIRVILQTLNITNLRSTGAKSINLHAVRKLIECSLRNCRLKALFAFTVFEILLSKCWSVLSLNRCDTGSKRVKVQRKTKKIIEVCVNFLTTDWLHDQEVLNGF